MANTKKPAQGEAAQGNGAGSQVPAVQEPQKATRLTKRDFQTITPDAVVKQLKLVTEVMEKVMQPGVHYGKIEGCGDKPTLLLPGAQKLTLTFRLAPYYDITMRDLPDGHREYEILTTIKHIPTGEIWGQGVGLCSSMESKYAFRKADRKCPVCGAAGSVIKGKEEYGGGWLCWKKKDGCGAKFNDDDPTIIEQEVGRIPNENIADTFNTVLKIAKKRSFVDVTIVATACSELFTQDLEDISANKEIIGQKPVVTKGKDKNFNPVDEVTGWLKKMKISEPFFKTWLMKQGYKEAKMSEAIRVHFDEIIETIKLDPMAIVKAGTQGTHAGSGTSKPATGTDDTGSDSEPVDADFSELDGLKK